MENRYKDYENKTNEKYDVVTELIYENINLMDENLKLMAENRELRNMIIMLQYFNIKYNTKASVGGKRKDFLGISGSGLN